MKKFFLLISLLSAQTMASEPSCPENFKSNANASKAFAFIRPFEGEFQMGSCKVELLVCDENATNEDGKTTFAADMLVTDASGFQRYIPFFVSAEKNNWSKDIMFLTERAFVYRFKDRNPDPETGKFERWDVEIVKTDDLQSIDYIEIGYSSENEQEARVGRNWIICGTEREREVLDHPVRHKIKSWWWWLKNPGKR